MWAVQGFSALLRLMLHPWNKIANPIEALNRIREFLFKKLQFWINYFIKQYSIWTSLSKVGNSISCYIVCSAEAKFILIIWVLSSNHKKLSNLFRILGSKLRDSMMALEISDRVQVREKEKSCCGYDDSQH